MRDESLNNTCSKPSGNKTRSALNLIFGFIPFVPFLVEAVITLAYLS